MKHQDLHEKLAENRELNKYFDFLNCLKNHPLFFGDRKMVTLLFKYELGGQILEEIIGLEPRMFYQV